MVGLRIFAAACGVIGLAACTTELKVYKQGAGEPDVTTGRISYALPKKTFVVTATYVLKDCTARTDVRTQQPSLVMEVDTAATLTAVNELDESERYYLTYDDLRTLFKETNVVVESHGPTQTLKSFNGTINDQAGALLTASISTAVKLGALVASSSGPSVDRLCSQETQAALLEIKRYRKKLQDMEASKAAKPPNQDALNQDILKSINAIVTDKLTTKRTWTWTPVLADLTHAWAAGYSAAQKELAVSYAAQKWLTPAGIEWLKKNPEPAQNVYMLIYVPSWSRAAKPTPVEGLAGGLVLRDPAIGAVRLCRGPCTLPQDRVVSDDNLLKDMLTNVAFPQFGRKRILPLKNDIGQNSALEITMTEDGVLTKVGMHTTGTLAKTVSELGSAADTARTANENREKAKAAAAAAERTKIRDDNKLVSECLDAQKNIIKNGGTPVGSCQ